MVQRQAPFTNPPPPPPPLSTYVVQRQADPPPRAYMNTGFWVRQSRGTEMLTVPRWPTKV